MADHDTRSASSSSSSSSSSYLAGLVTLNANHLPYYSLAILALIFLSVGVYFSHPFQCVPRCARRRNPSWVLKPTPIVLVVILHWLSSEEISRLYAQTMGLHYCPPSEVKIEGCYSEGGKERNSLTPWVLVLVIVFLFWVAHKQSTLRQSL